MREAERECCRGLPAVAFPTRTPCPSVDPALAQVIAEDSFHLTGALTAPAPPPVQSACSLESEGSHVSFSCLGEQATSRGRQADKERAESRALAQLTAPASLFARDVPCSAHSGARRPASEASSDLALLS